jgi:hypothetical protein
MPAVAVLDRQFPLETLIPLRVIGLAPQVVAEEQRKLLRPAPAPPQVECVRRIVLL